MAKTVNHMILLFAVAIFAIVSSQNLVGSASAWTISNDNYSHEHATDLTNPTLVCGDHKCVQGERPQHAPVVPVKEIQ
ncbi:MAG: hypothetical protein ACREAD_00570 [Nitrosopumilaceae archaeon]